MAASCKRFLTTKKRHILYCGKSWARSFASNSKGTGNGSPDSKTVQEENVQDSVKPVKRFWTEPIPEHLRGDHLPNPVRNTEREYFESHLKPETSAFGGKYFSKQRGISKDIYAWLQWDININDTEELNAVIKRREYINHKKDQRYLDERTKAVGPELGAAHFILTRGGAVKFVGRDHWVVRDSNGRYPIPKTYVANLFIEAIDASNMKLIYIGFDVLESLSHLRFLRLRNCPYIDDWCLGRLQRLRNTLEFLDISNCPGVTDNGLSALQCLHKLQGLHLSSLENVKHLGLLALHLEERIPGLTILGVEDQLKPPAWKHRGERRLVRALLGYMDEDKDEVTIGKVQEQPSIDSEDYNNIFKRVIRRVE